MTVAPIAAEEKGISTDRQSDRAESGRLRGLRKTLSSLLLRRQREPICMTRCARAKDARARAAQVTRGIRSAFPSQTCFLGSLDLCCENGCRRGGRASLLYSYIILLFPPTAHPSSFPTRRRPRVRDHDHGLTRMLYVVCRNNGRLYGSHSASRYITTITVWIGV